MRRKLAIVLAMGVTAGLLAGCGSGESVGTENTAEATSSQKGTQTQTGSSKKVNIRFWRCMGLSNGELTQEIVDSLNTPRDEVVVKVVHQGSYTNAGIKIQAALVAGEAPVLAQMEIGMLGVFADTNQLTDLQKFVDVKGYDIGDFMPGLLGVSYYNNTPVALSHSRNASVLYYDKNCFREAGLNEDKPPMTRDELRRDSGKLAVGGTYEYSCSLDQRYYMFLVMNAGGTIFSEQANEIGFDEESGIKPLYLWKEMMKDGTMYVPSGQNYNSPEVYRNAFAGGTTATVMQSSAQLEGLGKTYEFQVGVGAIPRDTILSYPADGFNLLMFKGYTGEEGATGWEFLKLMTDTENALKWANGIGYLPTRQSCTESDTSKKMIEEDPSLRTTVDQIQYSTYKTLFIPQYQEAKEIFANEIQKCVLEDNHTPGQTVESTRDRIAKLF